MRTPNFPRGAFCLTLLASSVIGAQSQTGHADPAPQSSFHPTPSALPATLAGDGGIRTPFSRAEETFYQQAWPIRKSHSAQALMLTGGVFLILLVLLLRKMFKSPPRKPPVQ